MELTEQFKHLGKPLASTFHESVVQGLHVGLVVGSHEEARAALNYFRHYLDVYGVSDVVVCRVSGRERVDVGHGGRLVLFKSRTVDRMIRGFSLDAVHLPWELHTPDHLDSIVPAVCTSRGGRIETY